VTSSVKECETRTVTRGAGLLCRKSRKECVGRLAIGGDQSRVVGHATNNPRPLGGSL